MIARAPSGTGVIFGTTPGGAVSQAPDGGQIATFTASGCLSILDSGCGASANYLIVAGGAGAAGAANNTVGTGGGGAGGYRTSFGCGCVSNLNLGAGTYSVTIGCWRSRWSTWKWSKR